MKKSSKTQLLPLALLLYLAVMAYMGRGTLLAGEYLHYFGVIGVSLIIIVLIYILLRKRDKIRAERDEKLRKTYGRYDDNANENWEQPK